MSYELVALVIVNLAVIAVAWGRREQMHKQNSEKLTEISADVKRINGTVERHKIALEFHAKEIDRLRRRRGE